MIKVDEGAQRTDAFQEARNLLLGKKAHADAIPGLEILADDVRCTHAAAIAQIDPEQIFYLRSRGLSETDGGAAGRRGLPRRDRRALRRGPDPRRDRRRRWTSAWRTVLGWRRGDLGGPSGRRPLARLPAGQRGASAAASSSTPT